MRPYLRMVFISGMPEPMACGASMWTTPVLKRTRKTGRTTQAKYCAAMWSPRCSYSHSLKLMRLSDFEK